MIFIMEDNPLDYKSRLLSNFDAVKAASIFAGDIGCVKRKIKEKLDDSSERIVAIFDLPVNNIVAYHEYGEIRRMTFRSNNRLLGIPVPCSEYFFVRSIKDRRLVMNEEWVNVCRNIDVYQETSLYLDNVAKCKSFESYCKLVLLKGFRGCVSVKRKHEGECFYFVEDCSKDGCELTYKLSEKAKSVVREYPVLPTEFDWQEQGVKTAQELCNIHRQMVDMFNDSVTKVNAHFGMAMCSKVSYSPDWSGS